MKILERSKLLSNMLQKYSSYIIFKNDKKKIYASEIWNALILYAINKRMGFGLYLDVNSYKNI
jgi:hypothetical protein